MKYNKKNQPFDIIGRFRILEEEGYVEYCRIRFFNTRKVQVVRAGLIATGEFEDASVIEEGKITFGGNSITSGHLNPEKIVKAINEAPASETTQVTSIDLSGKVEFKDASEASVEASPENTEIKNVTTGISMRTSKEDFTREYLVETDDFDVKYIATNPKGEKIDVYDLESFVAEKGLDMEAVQAVLDKKQKTHRKWRFVRV